MDKALLNAFWAHALPCVIISSCMLGFAWLAIQESDVTLSSQYLVAASVVFIILCHFSKIFKNRNDT